MNVVRFFIHLIPVFIFIGIWFPDYHEQAFASVLWCIIILFCIGWIEVEGDKMKVKKKEVIENES